jgi:predicted HTH domain antitoxin
MRDVVHRGSWGWPGSVFFGIFVIQLNESQMGQIILPSQLFEHTGKSEAEIRLAIAIFLYQELKLPAGKAGAFAGLSRIAFWEELGKRNIPLNYGPNEFEEDLESLKRFKPIANPAQ